MYLDLFNRKKTKKTQKMMETNASLESVGNAKIFLHGILLWYVSWLSQNFRNLCFGDVSCYEEKIKKSSCKKKKTPIFVCHATKIKQYVSVGKICSKFSQVAQYHGSIKNIYFSISHENFYSRYQNRFVSLYALPFCYKKRGCCKTTQHNHSKKNLLLDFVIVSQWY